MGSVNDAFGDSKKQVTWCRIAGGKVVRSAKADTPGAIKVESTDKDGKGTGEYTYQVQNGEVTGHITGHSEQTDVFDGTETKKLVVHLLHPAAGNINLTIKEGSRYWHGYVNSLPNVDLRKPVTFGPYDYVNKAGDRKIGMGLKQGGEEVKYRYNKDSTDGPPALQPIMLANGKPLVKNGRTQYDWDPIIEWHKANTLMAAEARLVEARDSLPSEPTPAVVERQTLPPEDMQMVYGDGGKDAPKPPPIGEEDGDWEPSF